MIVWSKNSNASGCIPENTSTSNQRWNKVVCQRLSTFFNSDIWLRMKVEPTYIYRRVSTLKLGCLFYLKIRLLYHNITSVERNHQNWIWHQPKFNFVFNVDFNVESTLAIRRWLRWFNVDITSTDINMHQSWVPSEIIIFII